MQSDSYRFPAYHRSGTPYGLLHETSCQEQISVAYAQAVATAARCKLEEIRVDDEKVDAVIRQQADHPLYDGVSLDVQLKCTTRNVRRGGCLSWRLDRKAYDKLRSPRRYHPRILVLVVVPRDFETWVVQDDEALRIVSCAYWVDLLGKPATSAGSISVDVPGENVFNVEQLLGILARIGSGGQP